MVNFQPNLHFYQWVKRYVGKDCLSIGLLSSLTNILPIQKMDYFIYIYIYIYIYKYIYIYICIYIYDYMSIYIFINI